MRNKPSIIDQIPDEVLMHIFSFLGLASIPNASLVQHRWHQLLCDNQFWFSLLLRDFSCFYPNHDAINTSKVSPKVLYQKEYNMKMNIQNVIFDKMTSQAIMQDEKLWETLYQRIFKKPKEYVSQWQPAFYLKAGDLGNSTNKFNILVRSGYADLLQIFIERIKNASNQIKHTKESSQQPCRKKPRSESTSHPRLNELINNTPGTIFSPLQNAAFFGRLDIAQLLLNHHANVNLAYQNGSTALYIAAQEGQLEIVQLLLDNHAKVNQATNIGSTPLIIAAEKGRLEIAQFLLDHHANVNQTMNTGDTPLSIAVHQGHLEIVRLLLDHHANVNQACDDGVTPLFIAVQEGHLDIVQLLLDHHANVNQASNDGYTPLFIAAHMGHLDIANLLLDHHANVNQTINSGYTAFSTAVHEGQIELVRLFLDDQHVNINQACDGGYTPLYIAAQKGYLDIVELLLDHCADVNKASEDGITPLSIAVQEGHYSIVKLLIANRANVNQACNDGETPLHIAVQFGYHRIIKLLIINHANVNQSMNDYGYTALFLAVCRGHLKAVKLLIQHGADYRLIPEQLLRKYPNANICYQKAQEELLKEQQLNSRANSCVGNTQQTVKNSSELERESNLITSTASITTNSSHNQNVFQGQLIPSIDEASSETQPGFKP